MPLPASRPRLLRRLWKESLEPVVFAVVLTQFGATLVGVDGVSMMPNLRNHERVFVPKYETWLHKAGIGDFKRGDILVFKPPRAAAAQMPALNRAAFGGIWSYRPFLIKRLVGLPGDRVRVTGGEVFLNGARLDSSWTTAYWQAQGCWDTDSDLANHAASAREGVQPDAAEITVPPGHYFLMGDNRSVRGSEDSRAFGTVPQRDVAGRAAAVVWPVLRQQTLSFDCGATRAGTLSGATVRNWRVLNRPEAFSPVPRRPNTVPSP